MTTKTYIKLSQILISSKRNYN